MCFREVRKLKADITACSVSRSPDCPQPLFLLKHCCQAPFCYLGCDNLFQFYIQDSVISSASISPDEHIHTCFTSYLSSVHNTNWKLLDSSFHPGFGKQFSQHTGLFRATRTVNVRAFHLPLAFSPLWSPDNIYVLSQNDAHLSWDGWVWGNYWSPLWLDPALHW